MNFKFEKNTIYCAYYEKFKKIADCNKCFILCKASKQHMGDYQMSEKEYNEALKQKPIYEDELDELDKIL